MKQTILLSLLILSFKLYSQDKNLSKELKENFNNKEYDKCISLCNTGIDKYNSDQLSEFYLFKSLSYYYLAKENRENKNYSSNIKNSVKSIKKGLKKDKVGSYFRIYETNFISCKNNLLKESIYLEQKGKPALANYIRKKH